jgi:hypothetical protein
MSFRLFIYYCAICGAAGAFLGWALGRFPHISNEIPRDGIRGMFLGMMIALSLSLVDSLWNLSLKQAGQIAIRVLVAVVVGCVGGLMGGLLGSWLYYVTSSPIFVIFGWTLTGFLVGASVGVFEVLSSLVKQQDMSGSQKKLINGVLGGTVGGVLGGVLFVVFSAFWSGLFKGKDPQALLSPTSTGFVALGACIGVLIGLAQVIFKEAWIKVEAGFRAGREKIISKGEITIGRAESCDIGLFGDNTIERLHAKIAKKGTNYFLLDNGTPAGTYLNGNRIARPEMLQTGDAIKVGNCLLRFGERQKRKQLQGM